MYLPTSFPGLFPSMLGGPSQHRREKPWERGCVSSCFFYTRALFIQFFALEISAHISWEIRFLGSLWTGIPHWGKGRKDSLAERGLGASAVFPRPRSARFLFAQYPRPTWEPVHRLLPIARFSTLYIAVAKIFSQVRTDFHNSSA